MNPQQIQQVRLISQEQIALEIDKLKPNNNSDQYQKIIKQQQEENDHLKKLISQQKEELDAIVESINVQVNNHLEKVNKKINEEIAPIRAIINSLIIKLNKMDISSAIKEYYNNAEERLEEEININNEKIKENTTKEKEYIEINTHIEQLEEHITNTTISPLIRDVLTNQIDTLKHKKDELDINDIRAQLEECNKYTETLMRKRERVKHLNV